MKYWETNFALSGAIKELRTSWQAIEWAVTLKEVMDPQERSEIERRLKIIREYATMIEEMLPAKQVEEAA